MNPKIIYLSKSPNKSKKFMVIVDGKKIHFGDSSYEDFTQHKDPQRKERYIARHIKREKWDKSGMKTSGFYSRWLLWNLPSLSASIKDTEKRFGIKIIKK